MNSGLHIAEIEVTNRCNLNCKHCYRDKSKLCDMAKEKVFDLIDQFSELEVHRLAFTGGEPLLIKEIFGYAKHAKKKGITQVVLMTNGLLINEKNIENIKIFDLVQLSIDVPPGEKGSFRIDYSSELEKKIDLLKKNGMQVHLQATIHRSLLPHMKRLFEFAKEKKVTLGLNRLVLIGNAKDLEKEKLSPLELKKCLEEITEERIENPLIRCSDVFLFLVDKERMRSFEESPQKKIMGGCIAGISTLYVKADGDVLICPFIDHSIASVLDKRIKEIWFENETLKKLRDRSNIKGKCGKCKYLAYCGGCRGAALRTHNSLFDSDPNCWLA